MSVGFARGRGRGRSWGRVQRRSSGFAGILRDLRKKLGLFDLGILRRENQDFDLFEIDYIEP